jgi:hypothetical protein
MVSRFNKVSIRMATVSWWIPTHLVLVRAHAEVLDRLTRVLGTPKEESVGTGGLLLAELVESESLTTGGGDTSASRGGEAQSSDGDLGDGQNAVVIRDSADDDDRLLLIAVLEVGNDARQRHGRAVDTAHEQAAQDDLVEGRLGTAWRPSATTLPKSLRWVILTSQEAVELHQELQVDIVALGGLTVSALDVVVLEIDT